MKTTNENKKKTVFKFGKQYTKYKFERKTKLKSIDPFC